MCDTAINVKCGSLVVHFGTTTNFCWDNKFLSNNFVFVL